MNIIETQHLTKYYGKTRGILDVNLEIHEGEIFGFIGPNGGGIVVDGGMLITINGTVSGNTVDWQGGGIFIFPDGTVNFGTSNLIQGNTANNDGGGIFNVGGTIAGAPRNYGSGNTPNNCTGVGCP